MWKGENNIMKYEQTVETLPAGIMTCFIGDEEVGILEFSPSHIKIRRAKKFSESLKPLKLVFSSYLFFSSNHYSYNLNTYYY